MDSGFFPWLHEWISIHVATARDRVWGVADAIVVGVGACVVAPVVANGSRVPLVGAGVACIVVGVVDEVVAVEGVFARSIQGYAVPVVRVRGVALEYVVV